MSGWRQSVLAALRVCGPGRSAALLLLMVAYHYSAKTRRNRRRLAAWILQLTGAPRPIRLRLRRYPNCVWLRPFDEGDVQSFIEVFVRRVYPVPERGGLVLDAGANVGFFSVFALQEGDPEKVIAIEPDPRNIPLLRRNLRRFGDHVIIVQAALWSAEGYLQFVLCDRSNLGHLRLTYGMAPARARTISVKTLSPDSEDIPPPERIDYLKLDIEGAEGAVLDAYLRRLSPGALLVGELHGHETIDQFRNVLSDRWTVIEDRPPDCLVFTWTAA